MQHTHASVSEVQNALRPFRNPQRLTGLVKAMTEKIELLDEDNRQLRAAVTIYCEIIRRSNNHVSTLGQ
ncbi:MAG TPA: hypothetical protein VGZ73_15980 [Bryobacteraceae bacterium]|jgi:hypothetical protein|nr:hypothetical protein [Bryobacteraceae bacterium]